MGGLTNTLTTPKAWPHTVLRTVQRLAGSVLQRWSLDCSVLSTVPSNCINRVQTVCCVPNTTTIKDSLTVQKHWWCYQVYCRLICWDPWRCSLHQHGPSIVVGRPEDRTHFAVCINKKLFTHHHRPVVFCAIIEILSFTWHVWPRTVSR